MRRRSAVLVSVLLGLSFVSPAVWSVLNSASAFADTGAPAVSVSVTGSYLVGLRADPLVPRIAAADLSSAAAKAAGEQLDASHDAVLADAGIAPTDKVQDYKNALNGFSAKLDHAEAQRLAADPKVAYVLPDDLRQATAADDNQADADPPAIRAERNSLYQFLGLSGEGRAWESGFTGEGVVIGVIDTGIWPEHPSFVDDGSYPPLPTRLDSATRSACDFGNTAANANDVPFTCNNKLVGAREMLDTYRSQPGGLAADEFDSARDDQGHGTHTASTAAGDAGVTASIFDRVKGTVSGIAPRAQIIAYKALGNLGGYTSDLVAAIDQAVADGVDVINYSIGGGADTVSPDTIALLSAAAAGVYSTVSAGNGGPAAGTIGGPADVPWVTTVGANTQSRFYDGYVRLGNGNTYRGSSITHGVVSAPFVDGEFAGMPGIDPGQAALCVVDALDPAKVAGKIVLCQRGQNGRVAKSFEVLRAGGAGMVLYNQTDMDTLFSDNFFVPTVMVDNTPGLELKHWMSTTPAPTGQLSAGALGIAPFASPTMASFSSRGQDPTSGDIIKPDLTAPGVQILAGASPFPDPGSAPTGQLFQAISGTSMSSPVVAGMYALIKQAHPDWSPAAAKSALMTTANPKVKDSDRVSDASPFAMGSGMARTGKPAQRGSAFDPGLIYDSGYNEYLGFLCEAGPSAFVDPAGTCAALAASNVPVHTNDLNYPSIGDKAVAGSVTLTRTLTSVADTAVSFQASVAAPAGFTASVAPSQLTLAPGDSASFQITLTNDGSAPLGQWVFGTLTWSGGGTVVGASGISIGGYNVHSPIAVQAQ